MPIHLPTFQSRTVLRADDLNQVKGEVEASGITVAAPLEMQRSSNGTAIRQAHVNEEIWARVTGVTSGVYSWTEVLRSGSSWIDGALTGTAVELNGASISTGTRVLCKRSPADPNKWVIY